MTYFWPVPTTIMFKFTKYFCLSKREQAYKLQLTVLIYLMEFNFPRDYFSKDQFMCFADFSIFLCFDFSVSTKIDPTKLLKLQHLHKRKKKWQNFHVQQQIHTKINLAKINFCQDLSPYVYICCQCVIISFFFLEEAGCQHHSMRLFFYFYIYLLHFL